MSLFETVFFEPIGIILALFDVVFYDELCYNNYSNMKGAE